MKFNMNKLMSRTIFNTGFSSNNSRIIPTKYKIFESKFYDQLDKLLNKNNIASSYDSNTNSLVINIVIGMYEETLNFINKILNKINHIKVNNNDNESKFYLEENDMIICITFNHVDINKFTIKLDLLYGYKDELYSSYILKTIILKLYDFDILTSHDEIIIKFPNIRAYKNNTRNIEKINSIIKSEIDVKNFSKVFMTQRNRTKYSYNIESITGDYIIIISFDAK